MGLKEYANCEARTKDRGGRVDVLCGDAARWGDFSDYLKRG
jgi:hypothetical protein